MYFSRWGAHSGAADSIAKGGPPMSGDAIFAFCGPKIGGTLC